MSSWGGGIILYRTYALYQDKHKYNVIKGVIPDFGYDVKFAIKVDGNKVNEIPESQAKGSNGKFYKVEVNCDNNVDGEWDYNAWNVKLNGVVENSKCTLSFVSNMSDEERDNILKAGVTYRRNTYRGQDITKYKTGTKINGRDLYQQISDCTFDDIYVGDYIKGNNNVTWLIADLNNYLHTGDVGHELTKCHATIIPAGSLGEARMNPIVTTGVVQNVEPEGTYYGQKGGYLGSEMKNITLPKILTEKVEPDFKGHIITYRTHLSSAMDESISNQSGVNVGGASSGWEWVNSQIDLMSEVNVYGSIVWSSSGLDIGIDNCQYAIFKLRPDLINADLQGNRYCYRLKAVATQYAFALVYDGEANYSSAEIIYGIRPRFLID